MFIPGSFAVALAMMLLGMICWGSWPSIQKAAGQWPFELFYYDFSFGFLLAAVVIALTAGTMFGGTSWLQNVAAAESSTLVFTILSGVVWNVANVLLVNGISLVGMAVAFPVAIGIALVLSTIGGYLVMPRGDPMRLAIGVALVFAAVILNSLAYSSSGTEKRKLSRKGLTICIVAGVLISTVGPIVGKALSASRPLSPYGVTLLFTLGAFLSTFPILHLLVRHPLGGTPAPSIGYWVGTPLQHFAGVAAGSVWTLGTALTWVAANLVGIALAMAIGQANPLIAAVWGVFVWREFRGAPPKSQVLLAIMFALYLAGLAFLALSARRA
jgi:glucose uptake protein